MAFDPTRWTRMEFEGVPIYVQPDKPDWFVPNRAGDALIRKWARGGTTGADAQAKLFLRRLPEAAAHDYPGRSAFLKTDVLRELWLHVTNRCNLTCSHCLVRSSPGDDAELSAETALDLARQASRLGCRLFALTGGEPFVHREIERIVDGLLSLDGAHVVLLTNGALLRRHADLLTRIRENVHLQISLDGLRENHDRLRGTGQFDKLRDELAWLKAERMPYTISMCVDRDNVGDMPRVVDLAAERGAANVHFLWYFIIGRAKASGWAEPERIFASLRESVEVAERVGIGVDNIDALKTQVFAPTGTRHDGSTSGWESVAVGPRGRLYPSPALIADDEAGAPIDGDLAKGWRTGPLLNALRTATAAEMKSPLRFLLGGGDPDHSMIEGHSFFGRDPYQPLYERTALWLIAREASRRDDDGPPRLRLKMGDVLESCGAHGAVALTHSNCLLAVAEVDGRTAVKEFYTEAATSPRGDILNPVAYPEELIAHIPAASRVRTYGCGSPVLDAGLRQGDCVLDLGSGSGVECMIAARMVGRSGRVIGVDMLDPMLDLARKGAAGVAKNLGYDNMEFRKGYLESLPLDDASVDVALSNCVVNLSTHKRRTFGEILRVLKPGGRLMISDVVCETEPDPAIRNDDQLRGECIAGALMQRDLFGILDETGFVGARVIRRFPYRVVRGHPFFSMTYEARKSVDEARAPGASIGSEPDVRAASGEALRVMYRGPFPYAITHAGTLLPAGQTVEVARGEIAEGDAGVFVFDGSGAVTNVDIGAGCECACATPPEKQVAPRKAAATRRRSGCMLCGAPLVYGREEREAACCFCGRTFAASVSCENEHFVCDECHIGDALVLIEHVCLRTNETDMIALLETIRSHPAVSIHGPEHHAMVPGIILSTYRNLGGKVTDEMIRRGIRRGAELPGGYCGFMGVCAAAIGVGVAFAVILDSNPMTPAPRQAAQSVVNAALGRIASLEAARCCQRESWLALRVAAEESRRVLPVPLRAEAELQCRQMESNAECIGAECPLHPAHRTH